MKVLRLTRSKTGSSPIMAPTPTRPSRNRLLASFYLRFQCRSSVQTSGHMYSIITTNAIISLAKGQELTLGFCDTRLESWECPALCTRSGCVSCFSEPGLGNCIDAPERLDTGFWKTEPRARRRRHMDLAQCEEVSFVVSEALHLRAREQTLTLRFTT